ncbi:MAG: glycerol-3-phosphate acyltransferase [Chloroflexi bacterium]|nr:glycerol-3-phosphate acyltransferase [Chloroflexota bacterium]
MIDTIYAFPVALVIAYLLGSIPSAYLIGRWRKGIDIRQVGSKNMGTMNVFREVGPAAGMLVLFADGAKGIAAVMVSRLLVPVPVVELLAAAAAIAGHDFPVFLQFRGGMGGATAMFILLFLMPWSIPFFVGLTAVIFFFIRNLTVSYGLAFVVFPVISWFVYRSVPNLAFALAVMLMLFLYNIPRISAIRQKGIRDPGFVRKR